MGSSRSSPSQSCDSFGHILNTRRNSGPVNFDTDCKHGKSTASISQEIFSLVTETGKDKFSVDLNT